MRNVLAIVSAGITLGLVGTPDIWAGNLGAHQRISRVLPGKPFGDGRDGSLTVSASVAQSLTVRSCSGSAGSTSLSINSAGFSNGDVVLIHQSRGPNAGRWEINKVASGAGTSTLVMSTSLYYAYVDSGASQAQVIRIPQYTSVTINNNVTWRAAEWAGDINGFLIFAARDTLTVTGTISASEAGYVGTPGPNSGSGTKTGYCGEGTGGVGSQQLLSANGNGGGAGKGTGGYRGDGGAGGNGVAGETGDTHGDATGGTGGTVAGTADLSSLTFGGAGGSGATHTNSKAGKAGDGGGIVIVFARTIADIHALANDGQAADSAAGNNQAGASAGGAGGSTLIVCADATLGSSVVTATGGAGNTTLVGTGKTGAAGRIAVHYAGTVTGDTVPPLAPGVNLIQDSALTPNTPPDAPSDPRCENQTNPVKLSNPTPAFSWTFTDPDAGQTQRAYQILIGTTAADGSIWDSGKVISSASANVSCGTTLAWGTAYQWRVRVWDIIDDPSDYCAEQTFSLQSPPTSFNLVAPMDNVFTSNPLPAFQWSASTDPEGEPVRYALKISLDANFTEPIYRTVTGIVMTGYTPPAGQEIANGTFYWQVIASDGILQTASTQTWRLTVDTVPPLEPVLNGVQQDLASQKVARIFGSADPGQTMTFYHRVPGAATEAVLPGALAWNSNSFTFDPNVDLEAGTAFRAVASDAAGNIASSDTFICLAVMKNIFQDVAVFRGPSPGSSMRLERRTTYPFKIAVNHGAPVTVTAWLRKNGNYSGPAPTLTLTGLGITGSGPATDAMTAGTNTWEQLSVTGTPNADGVLTLAVETFSTVAGSATWIDDVSVSH